MNKYINNYLIIKHVVSVNDNLSLVFGFKKKQNTLFRLISVFGPNYLSVERPSSLFRLILSFFFFVIGQLYIFFYVRIFSFFFQKKKKRKGKMEKKN